MSANNIEQHYDEATLNTIKAADELEEAITKEYADDLAGMYASIDAAVAAARDVNFANIRIKAMRAWIQKKKSRRHSFAQQYARIQEATGLTTQAEIAAFLGIKQSSVACAMRKQGSVPANWLIALFDAAAINPDWIRYGIGPRTLTKG